MIDLERPDVVRFYGKVRKNIIAGVAGACFECDGVPRLDGHVGARRICWYLKHGEFGVPLRGRVENCCGNDACCRPAHQKFVKYGSAAELHPRRERDKKIRLLRGRGWKPADIAVEVGVSRRVVARVLKDTP